MSAKESSKGLRRLGLIALFATIAAAGILTVYAATHWSATARARKLKNPVPPTTDALAAGLQTYTDHCRSCHGIDGDGKGEKASELSVAPGDFTDARKMHGLSDGELFWQITRGRLPMPSFAGKLTEEKRWQVVDYIRTFAEKPAEPPSAQPVREEAPQP